MDDKTFLINPQAILFHDELDPGNGFETVACNWRNETYLKINLSGYKILRVIDEQPGLSLAQIAFKVKQGETIVLRFLGMMVRENIVFAR
ncbi:hypothetical protein HY405_02195 [Candidatus Microgenomates bacterium]|nr:hypothetical protein [Candidatus Microgenomates bacterium]